MEAQAFDGMTRRVAESSTRRGAFRLFGGAAALAVILALGTHDDIAAKRNGRARHKPKASARGPVQGLRKKRKKGRKRKKRDTATVPPPPPPPAPGCVRNCDGKTCGDDGCGGQCGTCPVSGQICSGSGQCRCPAALPDVCGEACLAQCSVSRTRDPNTCGCCLRNLEPTQDRRECCSQNTFVLGDTTFCGGRNAGEPCSFNEQCWSRRCLFSIFGNVCQPE